MAWYTVGPLQHVAEDPTYLTDDPIYDPSAAKPLVSASGGGIVTGTITPPIIFPASTTSQVLTHPRWKGECGHHLFRICSYNLPVTGGNVTIYHSGIGFHIIGRAGLDSGSSTALAGRSHLLVTEMGSGRRYTTNVSGRVLICEVGDTAFTSGT